jgi:hypothetical protein
MPFHIDIRNRGIAARSCSVAGVGHLSHACVGDIVGITIIDPDRSAYLKRAIWAVPAAKGLRFFCLN